MNCESEAITCLQPVQCSTDDSQHVNALESSWPTKRVSELPVAKVHAGIEQCQRSTDLGLAGHWGAVWDPKTLTVVGCFPPDRSLDPAWMEEEVVQGLSHASRNCF